MVEKHHCIQCNTWIQGDRISIRNHEASQRHKDRVTANATRRATEKEKADRNEAERLKELEDVERSARARFAMDMRGRSVAPSSDRYDVPIGAGPVLLPPQALEDDDEIPPPPPPRRHKITPPPPPPRPHNYIQQHHQQYHYHQPPQYHQQQQQQQSYPYAQHPAVGMHYPPPQAPPPPPPPTSHHHMAQPSPPLHPPPSHLVPAPPLQQPQPPPQHPSLPNDDAASEKSKGFYTVRGVVYLEGPAHESKLTKTKQCELWLDDEDSWVPVTITRIFTTTVHETGEKFKHYHVQRRDVPTAPPIQDVRSDALRIPLNMPAGMVVPAERDQTADFLHQVQQIVSGAGPAAPVQPAAPDYGGWSTVSVRVVDEEAERAAIEAEATAFEQQKTQIQIDRDNEMLMEESLHADNAMGAFNPWGGRYKGIALDGGDVPDANDDKDVVAAPVAFQIKKNRKPQGKRRVADDA